MPTKEELIALCLQLPGAYEDYPFDEGEWCCMRHSGNRRIFAMLFERQGRIWINVKNEPMWGDFWRQTYSAVIPAYHCNKLHWSSIIVDGSMSVEEILRLIQDSFDLTSPMKNHRVKAP